MSRPKVDWCVVDYKVQPPVLKCLRCGETAPLPLPAELRKVVARLDGFTITHKLCKPR